MTDLTHLEALLALARRAYDAGTVACERPPSPPGQWEVHGNGEVICEIDGWSEEVDEADATLISLAPDLADALRTALATISDLTRERDAAREALRWHGEQASGCRKIGPAGNDARHALDFDGGQRARAALIGDPTHDR